MGGQFLYKFFEYQSMAESKSQTISNEENGRSGSNGRTRELRESSPLLPDEEVFVDARPAWSAYAGQLLLAGVIALVGILFLSQDGGGAIFVLAVIVALLVVGNVFYQRRKVRYLVTDRRVLVLTGISSKATNEAWMEDVRGMQTGASFLERMLGHGHISISAEILPRSSFLFGVIPINAIHGSRMTLGGIRNYEEIAQAIRVRQSQRKSGEY